MTKEEEMKKRIEEEEDFINYPKYGNSLKRALESNSNGFNDDVIAKMLLIDKKTIVTLFEAAMKKIREKINI